jgi:hypothetical protein
VGVRGDGVLELGDASTPGRIVESQPGSSLTIRTHRAGTGLVHGWGTVAVTGELSNSGRVVADGYGADRALDLSTAAGVVNSLDNSPGGTNGWYAQRGGELLLPDLYAPVGQNVSLAWGESAGDRVPDLVNSLLLRADRVSHAGEVSIALVSLDRQDVPALPQGHRFIGLWRMDASAALEGVELAVRYDEAMAQRLGIDESMLKLWMHAPGGQWQRLDERDLGRWPDINILIGRDVAGDSNWLAISAPEPAWLGGVLLAGWMLVRRRRAA